MVGFSLGGNRALVFAATQPSREIKAIVSHYVGCWMCGQSYREGKFPPVLFLHGELDESTHPDNIKGYCDAQRSSGNICEFHIYKGVHHAFDTDSPNYPGGIDHVTTADAWERTLSFLEKHVKGKSK